VPFNAIVLGIEQLQADMAPHHHIMPDARDMLSILSEQTEVVTHILNDVLSLQKIEDGALTLDYSVFDMERMIRSTLYSFKAPCLERSLTMTMPNLNQLMHERMASAVTNAAVTAATVVSQQHFASLARLPNAQPVTERASFRFGLVGDVHRLRQV
jgi:K+-sensing histidine kinase KdpD